MKSVRYLPVARGLVIFLLCFAGQGVACLFEPGTPLTVPPGPVGIQATMVANCCFFDGGPYSAYGRSLLVVTQNVSGRNLLIYTLDRYEPYPFVPDQQSLPLTNDPLFAGLSATLCERVLGRELAGNPTPEFLSFWSDPLLILAGQFSDAFAVFTLFDSLVAGPFHGADFGLPNFRPTALAFDNDNLVLYVLDEVNNMIYRFQMFGPENTVSLLGVSPLPFELAGRIILNADFAEGTDDLVLLLNNPQEVVHLDMSFPEFPVYFPVCSVSPNIISLAVSEGYADLTNGLGQWVGVQVEPFNNFSVVKTPTNPNPLPMSYPVAGTYLEPLYGLSFAADPLETVTGKLEIHPWVDGPWWPQRVRGLYSIYGLPFQQFDLDEDGMSVAEITFGAGGGGDGWRLEFEPANVEEEEVVIQGCFEIERNGTLIYVQRPIRIQTGKEPDIIEPGDDGDVVDGEKPATGIVEYEDPSASDCTVVMRREVTNDVADDIRQVGQERDSLQVWWFYIRDANGNKIDSNCIPGGSHCACAAAVQNVIAHAIHNECLCQLINCFLGRPAGTSCDWGSYTEDQITRLVKVMGYAMRTNVQECGSNFDRAPEDIERFIRVLGILFPLCNCDHNIYVHHIPGGRRGDSLYWAKIIEEMDEKDQTIMLRVTRIQGNDTIDHRISIREIKRQVGNCVEVTIEDPGEIVSPVDVVINTTTVPPTIKKYGFDDPPYWQKITGAIAMSDSTPPPPPEDSLRRGDGGPLDFEYHVWYPVLNAPGAPPTFPLTNLHPGFWKYRVRTYFDGDSATTYRSIYVPRSPHVTVKRTGAFARLNWSSDAYAHEYVVLETTVSGAIIDTLGITTDTTFTTPLGAGLRRMFQVHAQLGTP